RKSRTEYSRQARAKRSGRLTSRAFVKSVSTMKQVIALAILAWNMSILSAPGQSLPENCQQCVVVTTDSWSATSGTLSTFERDGADWRVRKSQVPVVVGKNGLGWGIGVNNIFPDERPTKQEGDNKAPAGIFKLTSVFGYARSAATQMPYRQVTPDIL